MESELSCPVEYPESQLGGGATLRLLPTYRRNVVRTAYFDGGALRALRPFGGRGVNRQTPPKYATARVTARVVCQTSDVADCETGSDLGPFVRGAVRQRGPRASVTVLLDGDMVRSRSRVVTSRSHDCFNGSNPAQYKKEK